MKSEFEENIERLIDELGWWESNVDDKNTRDALSYLATKIMSITLEVKHVNRKVERALINMSELDKWSKVHEDSIRIEEFFDYLSREGISHE